MTKGLENLPFDGAELDIAVEALTTTVEWLTEQIGKPVSITLSLDSAIANGGDALLATARWNKDRIGLEVECRALVGVLRPNVSLFVALLDRLTLFCLKRNSHVD